MTGLPREGDTPPLRLGFVFLLAVAIALDRAAGKRLHIWRLGRPGQ